MPTPEVETGDDAAFVAAFRDTSLPATAFHHPGHVRMAWLYVREHGAATAAAHFAADLDRYYSEERLWSPAARAQFLMPDLLGRDLV